MAANKKGLGYRLKEVRKSTGFTQEDFARAIGIDKNTYWNYENDKRSPDSTTLKEINKITNVKLVKDIEKIFTNIIFSDVDLTAT